MNVPPGIMVEPSSFWCPRHLGPFRVAWPVGYVPATLWLLRRALERDDVAAAAGGRAESLDAVLRELGPICCLIGDEAARDATARALSDNLDVVRKLIQEGAGG